MNGTIDWFARNSVAANLMMAFIVVSGLLGATSTREEAFPEMELDRIQVEVPYLGAAPEEVEEGVNVRIEEAIQGIDGIKRIQSTASEGMGSVMVELDLGADARRVVDEVKSNVDAITTFPIQTEKPIVRELTSRQQVVDIAVSGDVDPFTLKQVTERVRDELTAIPEILLRTIGQAYRGAEFEDLGRSTATACAARSRAPARSPGRSPSRS